MNAVNLIKGVVDSPKLQQCAAEYFHTAYDDLARRVDRMMSWLLIFEWLGMVVAAVILAPRTWTGAQSAIHPHILAALLAGPAFIVPVIFVARLYPGRHVTRHLIAVAQILISVLLIDITGGRIETHFHVFGSLAFLAFYRDWRVIVTASALTAIDHIVRGIWWPQSVYGVLTASPWRWVEHAWWVGFEDFFLIVAGLRSITEMWETAGHKARLYWGAYHDVLTGLPNRRMLEDRFDAGHPDGTKAILFIDLDRFKQANDTLGHAVGDVLLTLIAERISSSLLPGQMLARVGGDEFVAILDGVSGPEEAMKAGAGILTALTHAFRVDGHELLLSASVGISLYPEHGTRLLALQERADKAMYVAKSQGRNRCAVFSSEVAHREEVLQEISRDLYSALPGGQLRVYYQPLMESEAQIISFEALLRWHHPVHGTILPSEFVPIAERSGLIISIGDWVLREACRDCALWAHANGRRLSVAVNVSAVQFDADDYPDRVMAVLNECGLDPSLLTLEVTEGTLVRDVARATRHLATLRDLGVRIALDDFGTGYSSLSYLTALPTDTIKLDRSFLTRDSLDATAVARSVIDLAHRLGLRVVAEGIETREQSDRMLSLKCDEMQGFFFSPPVPAASVTAFLDRHQADVHSAR